MPAGTFITIGIGAANRDPAEFPDPDRLDVAREPNRHLAFGSGAHVCAGLNVARLEGRIAIGRFLARFPGYRARRRARARRPRPLPRLPVDPGCARLSSGPLQCRSAGTLPPFSASLVITCLCSQMFMDAESPMLPV